MQQEKLTPSQLQSYLTRIGLQPRSSSGAVPPPNLHTLASVQWKHLTAVPFENLSLRLKAAEKHPVSTDLDTAFDKLIKSGRGGYCFEQNAVFIAALRALGFDVYDGAARVVIQPNLGLGPPPPPEGMHNLTGLSHRVVFVSLGGALWLADAGFGGEVAPLPVQLPPEPFRYTVEPFEFQTADQPYLGLPGARDLPLERAALYGIRPGLLQSAVLPDNGAAARFPQRVGYYLQKHSRRKGTWKDLYFFNVSNSLCINDPSFCG